MEGLYQTFFHVSFIFFKIELSFKSSAGIYSSKCPQSAQMYVSSRINFILLMAKEILSPYLVFAVVA